MMTENLTVNQIRVLSTLVNGDKYGLEIIKAIKEESGAKLFLGTLYNLMNSLEKKGYVKSRWGEATSERGGNRRKYYEITGAGENVLNDTRSSLMKLWGFEGNYSFSMI